MALVAIVTGSVGVALASVTTTPFDVGCRGVDPFRGLEEHGFDSLHPRPSSSLNMDPHNIMAEELAIADCCQGVEVRRTWAETELVRTFGGHQFPGTPDGMFEDWCGVLTCVQVVRVPLVCEMNSLCMQETLAQILLAKIVKSQTWLRATQCSPHDFVIFCWLPFSVPRSVVDSAEMLMKRIRELDGRFSLRLRVPASPGALFPALFASNHSVKVGTSLSCSDVATYGESEDEESDYPEWDITWEWEEEQNQQQEERDVDNVDTKEVKELERHVADSDAWECEWDITWVH